MKYEHIGHISDVEEIVGVPDGWLKREQLSGHRERQLTRTRGIKQFGVNHVILEPGAFSALRHWHEAEDEFVYVLSGQLTLIDNYGDHHLEAGSFCSFPAGRGNAHHLTNRTQQPVSYPVIGSRRSGQDIVHYPDDNLGPIQR